MLCVASFSFELALQDVISPHFKLELVVLDHSKSSGLLSEKAGCITEVATHRGSAYTELFSFKACTRSVPLAAT